MDQEEVDQDVADEVSEELTLEVRRCVAKRTTGNFFSRSELVDEQE